MLAKINTDENKVLAERFGIRHIPMVKLFVAGEAAGEFTGGLQVASTFGARMPATAVRAWVKTHISLNIHKKKWLLKLSSR